jgi:hypothetical protein
VILKSPNVVNPVKLAHSGHDSDFNQRQTTQLKNEQGFNYNDYKYLKFKIIFGQKPYDKNGNPRRHDLSFKSVLGADLPDSGKRGINDINVALVVMYFNVKTYLLFTVVDYDLSVKKISGLRSFIRPQARFFVTNKNL